MDAAAIAAAIHADIAALPSRDTASVRRLRRAWSANLKPAPAEDVIATARALEAAQSQEGKWVAYELIRFHKTAFAAVGKHEIAAFTDHAQSWYAVDALGMILIGPLWAEGRLPDALMAGWAASDDRWLKRSALVATVMLGRRGRPDDTRRTLALCHALAADRDDMVVKALSWALRELIKGDRAAVEGFMAELADGLPARAAREVRNKLRTGLKTPRASRR